MGQIALSFSGAFEKLGYCPSGPTVQYALLWYSSFSGDQNSPPRQIQFGSGVRIGIDAEHATQFQGATVPAPIEIEAPRIGVDFHRDSMFRTGGKDPFNIELIARPAQQLASHGMTKDRRVGIAECPQKALGLGILVQTKPAVNARYDKIESRQDIIGVVKGTVGQNIGLDALEYAKLAPIGPCSAARLLCVGSRFLGC